MRYYPFLILALIISGCFWQKSSSDKPRSVKQGLAVVKFGSIEVNAEVADQPEKMQLGLGGRKSLAKNQGMIFLFPSPQKPYFWMKGMEFPLDFIWINQNRVVDLLEEVPVPEPGTPDENLQLITPEASATAVLEVNAGFAKEHRVKIGDTVIVKKDD